MNKPNIIVLVIDGVKASHLPFWSYPKNTAPWLSKNRDLFTVYQWAFAPSNWSGPSHASIFTGQYPSEHGVLHTGDSLKNQETVATFLKDKGYQTFVSSPCPHVIPLRNFDQGVDQFVVTFETYKDFGDFDHWKALLKELAFGFESRVYYSLLKFQRFINQDLEKPFFGLLNFSTAHAPYQPPYPFGPKFRIPQEKEVDDKRLRQLTGERKFYRWFLKQLGFKAKETFDPRARYAYFEGEIPETNDQEKKVLHSWYDASIAYMDNQIANLANFLKKKNLFDNTALFIVADHGESFGEKRTIFHSFSLYNFLIHVPIIVKYPQKEEIKFKDWEGNVSLNDIFPTVKSLLGEKEEDDLRNPQTDRIIFSEEPQKMIKQYREFFPQSKRVEWYESAKKAVIKGDYKYIWYQTGAEELFNFKKDYQENENLVKSNQKKVKELRNLLGDTHLLKTSLEQKEIDQALSKICI